MANNDWTFLSNHSHVLVCLARDPDARMRDIAAMVGITERAVQGIIQDLVNYGAVERIKQGRRNSYRVNTEVNLRHPVESECTLADLLEVLKGDGEIKK